MSAIGRKEITIVISYVADYTNDKAYISDVKVGTSTVGEHIEYATLIGILEMAKIKPHDANDTEE